MPRIMCPDCGKKISDRKRPLWLAAAILACAVAAAAALWLPSSRAGASDGAWTDPTTGLTWQVNPAPKSLTWREAKAYCKGLSLGDRNDWRLPTVSELRSLIRGCPATQKGGSCGVTDSCSKCDCWNERLCASCSYKGGPGPGGAYWPPEISGEVGWYWPSSPVADSVGQGVWVVNFADGVILHVSGAPGNSARCVR